MGFGDFLLGKRSERWYRRQLENELKELTNQASVLTALKPKIFVREHVAKNLERMGSQASFSSLTEERIKSLIKDMKKYGYKYDDLLEKYNVPKYLAA